MGAEWGKKSTGVEGQRRDGDSGNSGSGFMFRVIETKNRGWLKKEKKE